MSYFPCTNKQQLWLISWGNSSIKDAGTVKKISRGSKEEEIKITFL